jgi:hypothetical protein
VTLLRLMAGERMLLTPEHSIQIQNRIGADIIMALDDVVSSVTVRLIDLNRSRPNDDRDQAQSELHHLMGLEGGRRAVGRLCGLRAKLRWGKLMRKGQELPAHITYVSHMYPEIQPRRCYLSRLL